MKFLIMADRELSVKVSRDSVVGQGKYSGSCFHIGQKAQVLVCSVFK